MSNRISYIDAAKGLTIIFVVLAHNPGIENSEFLKTVFKPLNIPFFFLLSGLFFRPKKSLAETFINKLNSLLKPFFNTLILVGIVKFILQGIDLNSFMFGIFYATGSTIIWPPLWFLPHLWLLTLFIYLIVKFTDFENLPIYNKILILSSLLVLGYITIGLFWNLKIDVFSEKLLLPGLPFSFDILFLSSFYFLLGFFARKWILNFKPNYIFAAMVLCFYLLLYLYTDCLIDFNIRRYDNLLFSTLAAFSCIYIALNISYLISSFRVSNKLFSFIGSMTLFILLFHYPLQYHLYNLFNSTQIFDSAPGVFSLVVSIFCSSLIGVGIKNINFLSFIFLPVSINLKPESKITLLRLLKIK